MNPKHIRDLLDRAGLAPVWSQKIKPAPVIDVDADQSVRLPKGTLTFGVSCRVLPFVEARMVIWEGRTWT